MFSHIKNFRKKEKNYEYIICNSKNYDCKNEILQIVSNSNINEK